MVQTLRSLIIPASSFLPPLHDGRGGGRASDAPGWAPRSVGGGARFDRVGAAFRLEEELLPAGGAAAAAAANDGGLGKREYNRMVACSFVQHHHGCRVRAGCASAGVCGGRQ